MGKVTAYNLIDVLPENSWFRDWMSIWPTAEPPKSFILFSGMSMLGAVLGRGVWLDQDVHTLYPMLNLLLIGPSGCGKSTAIKHIGFQCLQALPPVERPQLVEGAATPQALHSDLAVNPHAIVFASELANFFTKEKFMIGMIPYVTELLDYGPMEKRTLGGGLIRFEEPAATIVGGSTLEWLQDQLPDTATSGGFLARFLIVSEEHKGQKIALPNRVLSPRQMRALDKKRTEVFTGFQQMVDFHYGAIDFADYEAVDAYSEWYSLYTPATGHLAPFAARAGEFVLRLSMLLALSCGCHTILQEHVVSAIQLYGYCADKLQAIVVPMSVKGKMLAQVLHAVGQEPMPMKKLYAALRNSMPAQDVDQMLASLVQDGSLKRDKEGNVWR
jgi:energy-coupling factor transporter ATP-binding protein EcfA2